MRLRSNQDCLRCFSSSRRMRSWLAKSFWKRSSASMACVGASWACSSVAAPVPSASKHSYCACGWPAAETPPRCVRIGQSFLFYYPPKQKTGQVTPGLIWKRPSFFYFRNKIIISQMVKKSQLRKFTVEKIMELVAGETSGENLKMFGEAIADKNRPMLDRRGELLGELEDLRSRREKVFREMNDGVKDRVQLKAKTVMDKYSRPSKEDIREVTQLFAYIEHQHHLIQRNSSDLSAENQKLTASIQALRPQAAQRADPSDLDEQYFQLNEQCAREEEVRDGLAREREARLKHYSSIAGSIDQCRVEYELVEERIREKERELIQLTAYFETRKQEDQQLLNDLRERSMGLESELLKAQEILNNNSSRCEGLMIKEIQALGHSQQ